MGRRKKTKAISITTLNSSFAKRMAKILKWGTSDFECEVEKLTKKVNQVKKGGKPISRHTIRSWLTQGKFPKRKNIELVAQVLNKNPDELIAPDFNQNKIEIDLAIVELWEDVLFKTLPLLNKKYLILDDLPPQKRFIIQNILQINNPHFLKMLEQTSKISVEEEEEEGEMEK